MAGPPRPPPAWGSPPGLCWTPLQHGSTLQTLAEHVGCIVHSVASVDSKEEAGRE